VTRLHGPASHRSSPRTTGSGNEAQQHDLSEGHAARLVEEAGIPAGRTVLEVGPGLGALTAALLAGGARVVAVERDPGRVGHLERRFTDRLASGHLTLLTGDALHLMPSLRPPWEVLANPPFSLTAALVRRWLLEVQPAPAAIHLVLQREAAHKLTGGDGVQTRSSILARLTGTPQVVRHLPRDAVTPPSRVDLAVWRHRRAQEAPATAELAAIDRLLDIAFAGPHSMGEALRGLATGTQIRRQGAEQGWHRDDHPRTLTPEAWRSLARLLVHCGRLGAPPRRKTISPR
jgi:16S rRNA (adenine1518-N6/adenine1519-N6)-dimethyltransferase